MPRFFIDLISSVLRIDLLLIRPTILYGLIMKLESEENRKILTKVKLVEGKILKLKE